MNDKKNKDFFTNPFKGDATKAKLYMSLALADMTDPVVGLWLIANGCNILTVCIHCGQEGFEHVSDCPVKIAIQAMANGMVNSQATAQAVKDGVDNVKKGFGL